MRNYPKESYELEELKKLNAEDWMIEVIKLNPGYCSWGNYEDYMTGGSGWDKPLEFDSITEGIWELDDLNELVNFYFEIKRDNIQCEKCDGSGLNKATKDLSDAWYSFNKTDWKDVSSKRRYNNAAWQYHLTEVEIKELVKAGRLTDLMPFNCHFDKEDQKWYAWIKGIKTQIDEPEYPTPEQVNEWNKKGLGHDSINQWICVEARAKHLGIWGHCEHCEGGYIYTSPIARLALQLWILHPRKGCSRGVYIKDIKKEDMRKVIEHLKIARQRNQDRFAKLDEWE
jgi:hypothetical protein